MAPSVHLFTSILGLLALQVQVAFAQTKSYDESPTATASSTYNVFSAIASSTPGDGSFGVAAGNVGTDPTTDAGSDAAGAEGQSDGAINLRTGDQIAIAVVVGLVVILGIGSAILFYLAKKRQWEVRASLRRSAKRMTGALRPKTPQKSSFPRQDQKGMVRIDPPPVGKEKTSNDKTSSRTQRPVLDIEKGYGNRTRVEAAAPQSSFEVDSPNAPEGGKGWKKMFGGK